MAKTKIFYSIQNGGDGSAYPMFLDSEELSRWDQDNLLDGWGESCCGSIELKHKGQIESDEIKTSLEYYLEKYEYGNEFSHFSEHPDLEIKFLKKFFPDGLPKLKIKASDMHGQYFTYLGKKR